VCEEQVRDAKLIVFKKRRRKNSRRTNGHRQQLTALRVIAIDEAPLSVLL
jgi:large subunit ribosomal protein L21